MSYNISPVCYVASLWCVLGVLVVGLVPSLQLDIDNQATTRNSEYIKTTGSWSRQSMTPDGENWYANSVRLTYISSARIFEHVAKQGRKVTLTTGPRTLFHTPVGKSFFCPQENVIELVEEEPSNSTLAHRAKLYLRQMRLQTCMFKCDAEFGPILHCSDSQRTRSETVPVAVGTALAVGAALSIVPTDPLSLYTIWRYLNVILVRTIKSGLFQIMVNVTLNITSNI